MPNSMNSRNRIERTASKKWRGSVRRLVSAALYNLSCFTYGCSTGWVSSVLGVNALAEGAWLAALPCLVALPAAPFFAVLADAKGRKAGAFCICVSFILSWSLLTWCSPRGVWAARAAAGAGGAGALALAPLYSAEIAPRTRGLAALPAFAGSLGILFAYAAGGILSRHALSLSMAAPPAALLAALLWLPETPGFLISVGRVQDAAKVMCWFDGSNYKEDLTDVIEQQEVRIRTSECYGSRKREMYRQDSDALQPMLRRREESSGLESGSDRKSEPSQCRQLFRHRRTRRALATCGVLLTTSVGCGAGAVVSFAASLLRYTAAVGAGRNIYGTPMVNGTTPRLFETAEAASTLCAAALVLGAAVAIAIVDRLGRKLLLIWSCTGIACCLILLGAYCDPRLQTYSWSHLHQAPYKPIIQTKLAYNSSFENATKTGHNETKEVVYWSQFGNGTRYEQSMWPPVILLSAMLFLYNIGLGSVPFVLIADLFCINIRSLASSLLISWMWLISFLLLRYFNTAITTLGLHNTYYACASLTLAGSVYTCLCLPETRGRSQKQIDDALEGPWIVLRSRGKSRQDP